MKHYYYYIMAGREIDETAQFFKVAVGSSKQAQRDFLYLTLLACSITTILKSCRAIRKNF